MKIQKRQILQINSEPDTDNTQIFRNKCLNKMTNVECCVILGGGKMIIWHIFRWRCHAVDGIAADYMQERMENDVKETK